MADVVGPDKLSSATRKKFAAPPVKIACLACRASRTRCNGEKPCASCSSKGKECVYKPSRRGGPRIRRKVHPGLDESTAGFGFPDVIEDVPQKPISVENYIDPGAGLKQLNEGFQNSDFIFDALFSNFSPEDILSGPQVDMVPSMYTPSVPMARAYGSDRAILNAYYIWIHPFFPILPPPAWPLLPDEIQPVYQDQVAEEPSSPITLALSAILALLPCPQDVNYLAEESILFRRKYAQLLAQTAVECIEAQSERHESSTDPSKALEDPEDQVSRYPFHPSVPIELENIIALDILSAYEYTQRGNLAKMRTRAGAALVLAMEQSLHIRSNVEDEFSEAKRRAWWMTYICISQTSIVSSTTPAFEVFTPSFTAQFPTLGDDVEAFPAFVKAQQAILAATQFVIQLNKAREEGADLEYSYQRMQELEKLIGPLITASDAWILDCPKNQPVNEGERVVAHALKCIAKIKLNSARIKLFRYSAFFDIPVFSRPHCDLKPIAKDADGQPQQLSCCSTSSVGTPATGSSVAGSSVVSSGASPISVESPPSSVGDFGSISGTSQAFVQNSNNAARTCLQSALTIANSFEALPYPNPSAGLYHNATTQGLTPRTMPTFMCCCMQASYVLLMVNDRTKSVASEQYGNSLLVSDLLGCLQKALGSLLDTLENYGMAFEALGGMRDQVREKVYSAMILG